MGKCSECGKESMSFTCRYCGEKYCSEHRLPESHDCEKMEEQVEKEREETDKWFQDREVRKTPEKTEVQRPSLWRDALDTLKSNYTMAIIALTSFTFLVQNFVTGSTQMLMLDPSLRAIAARPWSLLTVMLVHGSLFHIFANMVTFYFFGKPFERLAGSGELLKFYIGSGLAASIGYIAFRNLLFQLYGSTMSGVPVLGPAVGASGAVVAVFAAVAMLYPEAEVLLYFFIPMKIRTALYLFAGVETFNLIAKTAGITLPVIGGFASSAHLTGLVAGVYYGRKLRQQYQTRGGVLDLLGY